VIMYADTMTSSIERSLFETGRRREKQKAYNTLHNITPRSIEKKITDILASIYERDYADISAEVKTSMGTVEAGKLSDTIDALDKKMHQAAKDLRFEDAASIRDEIKRLRKIYIAVEG